MLVADLACLFDRSFEMLELKYIVMATIAPGCSVDWLPNPKERVEK